ncbi:phenol-soluble modulin export ABC transporter permease subunit PmtB [Staphylococcus carnosus]|uniref:phenol-soluble modulin export ABC transporter permease subunit PmtB n=1 Tax=Staphylococcus carnosus TaxID=1281 RepID=UPI00081A9DB6|nr:ABC-2 transporter permease [Staphylococcus carnosus]ANZ32941.1 hypothetical protein BEK99_03405 [Staphylococcus carnosus]UTB85073.1 hypothetical protein A2I66_05010 [Staphylococcus carnosus]
MKQLILRNLKLRKVSLIIYAALIIVSPFYHLFLNKHTVFGGITYSILSVFVMFISLFDCGNAFRLQFKLGGNKAYYFNHSLPFSAQEQLNAHYLTTVLMSVAGAIVLTDYYNVPMGGEINGVEMTTPMYFIAINLIGHAIAFPKYSEVRRDFIPYWGFVVVVNFIVPVIFSMSLLLIAITTHSFKLIDNVLDYSINIFGIVFIIFGIILFGLTYFKQLKKINEAEQTY